MDKNFYMMNRSKTEKPDRELYEYHTHNLYEFLMLIEGDTSFIIDGNKYKLNPYDLTIPGKDQIHRIYHDSVKPYDRICVFVMPEFFIENNIKELEDGFLKKALSTQRKISHEICLKSGLHDVFMRMKKYSDNFTNPYKAVVKSTIIEMIYIINSLDVVPTKDNKNSLIKSIINYINDNFKDELSLDELSNEFYVSKHHLCRIFKKETGMSVYNYITLKRLSLVQKLKSDGLLITQASQMAGFKNYSSFYRAHIKFHKQNPSQYKVNPVDFI